MTTTLPVIWDFKLALEFSDSFRSIPYEEDNGKSKTLTLPSRVQSAEEPRGLGDFSRVYAFLGIDPPPSSIESEHQPPPAALDDESLSLSSTSEPAEDFEDFVNKNRPKGVTWDEEIDRHVFQKQGSKRHRDNVESADDYVPVPPLFQLIPSTVLLSDKTRLKLTPGLSLNTDPPVIQPFQSITLEQQQAKLVKKLRKQFSDSTHLLVLGSQVISCTPAAVDPVKGIHVFVDFSNIIIGFYNKLKVARGLHEKAYVKQPPLSYRSLALVFERGRPVARRVLVGSTSKNLYSHSGPQKVAKHFSEAESCGYEMNILDRVSKVRPTVPVRRKKNGTGNGYATATSGDESTTLMDLKRPVMAEQGVDELLQMKILESIIDTSEPTTIVLASGDAAEAEYSGGFFKTVQRALNKGWKVEIAAWGDGLSREYMNKDFLKKWSTKFQIIELDNFAEEFLAVYS